LNKIKYGIIGFGGIAENRIAKEGFGLDKTRFNKHPTAELVAVMDLNPERQIAAESLGLKWYISLEEMLNDNEIDAVFIATSNSSHATVAKKAMEKGKHCLIEKPIACSIEEAEGLQKVAKKCGVSITVDHMMIYNEFNKKAFALINSGKIGNINDICLHMEFLYGSAEEEAKSWRCNMPNELGGPIGDVGSHCLYMAEFLLGDKIVEIGCSYTPRTLNINVENGAIIHFKTQKGKQGTTRVAFNQSRGGLVGTLTNLGYEIYGTKGALRTYGTLFQLSGHENEPIKMKLDVDYGDRVESCSPELISNIYQQQISHHVQSINSKEYLDGSDAIHNLKLLLSCHKSAKNNGKFLSVN
jgi:predicted dehydrogenase